jgi:hypothetical protein
MCVEVDGRSPQGWHKPLLGHSCRSLAHKHHPLRQTQTPLCFNHSSTAPDGIPLSATSRRGPPRATHKSPRLLTYALCQHSGARAPSKQFAQHTHTHTHTHTHNDGHSCSAVERSAVSNLRWRSPRWPLAHNRQHLSIRCRE